MRRLPRQFGSLPFFEGSECRLRGFTFFQGIQIRHDRTIRPLVVIVISSVYSGMSAAEIIEQIKALPPNERAEVAKFFVEDDDSWVPESFKRGMADAEAGRFVDMETVLSGAKPPPRRTE